MCDIYVTNEFAIEYGDFKIPDGYTQSRIPGTTIVILHPDTQEIIDVDKSAEAVRNAESHIHKLHNRLEEHLKWHDQLCKKEKDNG